jgi:Ca-activated chloride channel family protein
LAGWSVRVRLDEDALKNIASTTRAEYFNASTADDLTDIYQGLRTRVEKWRRNSEQRDKWKLRA